MIAPDVPLFAAGLAPIMGIAILRLSWARGERSAWLNGLGWFLLAAGVMLGGEAAGAWGVAISVLFAMAAACLVLAWAGWQSAPGKQRASNRRVGMVPAKGEPLRIGGRVLTFVLVGVAATAVSLGLCIAARGLARALGLGDADSTAIALMTLPLSWSLIGFFLLMQERRRGQFLVLAVASLPVIPVVVAGVVG